MKKEFFIHRCKFREKNRELYPTSFKSKPEEIKFLSFSQESTKEFFEKLEYHNYHGDFKSKPKFYDLHNTYFQNFAIISTKDSTGPDLRRISISPLASNKRLLRARVYGISTQKHWSWNGRRLDENSEESERKLKEMEDISGSLVLYDWANQPKDIDFPNPRFEQTRHRFFRMGTQEAVEKVFQEYSQKNSERDNKEKEEKEEEVEGEEEHDDDEAIKPRIAWLNLANAHHVCGIYGSAIGGSQEEEVATNCTGCATLGICGKFHNSGPRSWVLGTGVHYKEGWHIPPGGNYFCKTRFLTGSVIPMDCFMIASAFCDLRKPIPFLYSNSERGDYFDFWGNVKKKKKKDEDDERESYLEDRLFFDIEGCVRTAIMERMDILVAGASGCGAFKHDPKLESLIWYRVLEKYRGYFKEVVFAVLDKEDSNNVKYFKERFGE